MSGVALVAFRVGSLSYRKPLRNLVNTLLDSGKLLKRLSGGYIALQKCGLR